MRRAVLPWILGALLLAAASVAGIALAGTTLFGASAFVSVYLDALARGDGAAAAGMPGARGDADPVTAASAMPGLQGIRILSDTEVAPGRHRIAAEWRSGGRSGSTTFTVERAGSTALLFPAWRFALAPTAALSVTTVGDDRIAIGSLPLAVRAGRPVTLLVPGVYAVRMRSPVAQSDSRPVAVDRGGARLALELTGSATPAFLARVTSQVRQAVAACARQQALFPAGCPFGASITDRIASPPTWTILRTPSIILSPTARPDVWVATLVDGRARLRLDVRSLYDGSVSPTTEEIGIDGSWAVSVRGDVPRLGSLVAPADPGAGS